MTINRLNRWLPLLGLAAACHGPTNSRERLASALKDRLGEAANPDVGFLRDSTHLLVNLATVAFRTVPDSVLTVQARDISRFALRRYESASEVDSITVDYREAVSPGLWYVRHERTFSVEDLRNAR